ncbi:MAG: glycosyltransferase, partial [Bacteroidota bacterium]
MKVTKHLQLPISVIIVTYNRSADLEITLNALLQLNEIQEIIIVNNGNNLQTRKMVEKKFPSVQLINLKQNLGIPAYNLGVELSQNPFLFFLDDDAIPREKTFQKVVKTFREYEDVAAVSCEIVDSDMRVVTRNWPKNPICFWGCGVGLRKAAILKQPYVFDPSMFLHGTELDLAIRLYDMGYKVLHLKEAVVHHRFSNENRSMAGRIYYLTQNAIWFPLKHFPVQTMIVAICRNLIYLFFKSVKSQCIGAYIRGIWSGIGQIRMVWKKRRVVANPIVKRYFQEVWEFEPILFRVARSLFGSPKSRKHKKS